jgi:predicted RecB family nuclease
LESSYNVEDKFLSDLINEGVDQEMLSHVMTYVNACNSAAICFSGTPAIRIEHRLAFDERMEMFGTADFIVTGLMDGIPTGMIVDLKYGKGKKVKTEENPQLAFYAVALKLNSKKALKRVIVQIVQPRMDYEPVAVEFSEDDLNRWREKLTLGAEQALWMASKHKEPKYTQGSWCWFCPAKSICPEVQRKVDEQVLSMFDDVPPAL